MKCTFKDIFKILKIKFILFIFIFKIYLIIIRLSRYSRMATKLISTTIDQCLYCRRYRKFLNM